MARSRCDRGGEWVACTRFVHESCLVSEKHDAQWLAGEQSVSSGLLPETSEAEVLDSVPDAQGHLTLRNGGRI